MPTRRRIPRSRTLAPQLQQVRQGMIVVEHFNASPRRSAALLPNP
jgi:hypothetical protein